MVTSEEQISPPRLAFKIQIKNCIVGKFPMQRSFGNNTKILKVCENVSQTRLGGEFELVT